MDNVVRLLKYSLLLRIVISLPSIAVAIWFLSVSTYISLAALGTFFPSLAMLVVLHLMRSQIALTTNAVIRILRIALLVSALEIVLSVVVLQIIAPYLLSENLITASNRVHEMMRSVGASPSVPIPIVFLILPAILGAWVEGKKYALHWSMAGAGFALIGSLCAYGLARAGNLEFIRPEISGFVAQVGVMTVVCYFVGSLADAQRQEHAALEAASRQLAEQAHMREQLATSRERTRMARDLHDTLAHSLAALSVQLDAIEVMIDGAQTPARNAIATARQITQQGLESTRRSITALRDQHVQALGLLESLRQHAAWFEQRTHLPVKLQLPADDPVLTDAQSDAIYRIVTETLTNIERHSQATQIEIKLALQESACRVYLSIADNGKGFDTTQVLHDRFGLLGMRERAELIGARLRINSLSGKGTSVILCL